MFYSRRRNVYFDFDSRRSPSPNTEYGVVFVWIRLNVSSFDVWYAPTQARSHTSRYRVSYREREKMHLEFGGARWCAFHLLVFVCISRESMCGDDDTIYVYDFVYKIAEQSVWIKMHTNAWGLSYSHTSCAYTEPVVHIGARARSYKRTHTLASACICLTKFEYLVWDRMAMAEAGRDYRNIEQRHGASNVVGDIKASQNVATKTSTSFLSSPLTHNCLFV